ncbi:MAG: tetrahydrofolate synthase [Treponema sp.]|jgi:dihydrofolate synthase/folylpolyglutamate synthase|nr:tetrahydrofolate synthase [Treponema sp.]
MKNTQAEDPPRIDSSSCVFGWISRFINLEKNAGSPPGKPFRLDRMEALAEAAEHPERYAPVIHVAGSKGKGTVTGMTAAILESGGLKTARYTSPDLGDRRQRITMGNVFFDEETYIEAGKELIRAEEKTAPGAVNAPEFFDADGGGEGPTFFELMTLYFFLCARKARCGAMAVETGMGGRLDATNIVDPLVSVITLIEREHTEYLGNTIGEIAGEKAGIIKRGKPLVLAEQSPEALEVFREKAERMGSPLLYLPERALVKNIRVGREGTNFSVDFPGTRPVSFPGLFVPIPGEIQAYNAALALLAAMTAFPALDTAAAAKALGSFTLPGRFEKVRENPAVIIDGAHTARSVEQCVKTFLGLYGRGVLLFGCAEGKDAGGMAEILVPHFPYIIVTAPGTFKKSSPEKTFEAFKTAARKTGADTEVALAQDTKRAVEQALGTGKKKGLPVLGTGSFYLAAEIRGLQPENYGP